MDKQERYCARCHEFQDPVSGSIGYYDRAGRRVTLMEWASMVERLAEDYKRVALTEIEIRGEPVRISTVWIGLNHQFGSGPPLIFETMVFGGDLHEDMDRYRSQSREHTPYVSARRHTPAGDPSPDHSPRDGDASLCLACATVNVYANDTSALRPPTVEERDEFTSDPQIQSATRSLLDVKERKAGSWPKGTKR